MELFPDFIHLCHCLRVLESNAFGGCVLQILIYQRQDGLLLIQSHPQTDQPLCFRALTGNSEAIAAAAAKWVLGVKSESARPAPVTMDTFHIHLTGALSRLIATETFPCLCITSCGICPWKEAVTETAEGIIPVAVVAL